jgi:hypothetical protein
MQDAPQQSPPDNPGWLASLQHDSWQAEILISGGGLLGVIAIYDSVGDVMEALLHGTTMTPNFVGLIGPPIALLAFVLAQAFILHLILRGYWIGLVGFNVVFPQGVNGEKLRFQGKFKSLIRNGSNTPYLARLDGLCSVIFAFSFLIILSITGFVLYIMFAGGVGLLLSEVTGLKVLRPITGIVAMTCGALVLIDFLSIGYLKRIRWLSPFYYPVHYFVSHITLWFLYRRLYYSIGTNIRPVYLTLAIAVQVLLYTLVEAAGDRIEGVSPIRAGEDHFMVLEDEIVRGNSLGFSFSHFPRLEEELFSEWEKSHKGATAESFDDIPSNDKVELISSLYIVTIDSARAENLAWIVTNRDVLGFVTTRLQYLADVRHLERGRHELGLRLRLKNSDYTNDSLAYLAKAYFLVDK